MNTRWFFGRLAGVIATGLCVAFVTTAVASDEGQAAADQVSLSSYQGFLNNSLYTHNGNSRGPNGAHHDPARNNILALFQSYGLTAALEPFTYSGNSGENVVATKLGTTYPNQIFVVGGHYDSVSNPGADDNASGVAAVLETARILSQYPSEYTIKFVAFDLEELGLYGSEAYCAAHSSYDIRGMLSLDMVCYDPNTNHALIYGRTASNPIKNAIVAAVNEYSGGLTTTVNGQLDASDHAPFEEHGWQACLLIEGDVWDNPYYHTQQDSYETVGNLNFSYAVKMTRSAVGWLVDAAGVQVPIDKLAFSFPDGRPEYSYPNGATTVRVEVAGVGSAVPVSGTGQLHYKLGSGTWTTVPMTEVSPNVYDADFPPGTCGTTLSYYFSAQAVGGQWFNDPRNAPDTVYAALVAYGVDVVYENLFGTNPGWTISGGQWAYGTPTGGGGEHGGPDPTAGYTGTKVYGYNLNGDYANSIPEYHLTSSAINCAGVYGIHLTFWRWLGVEQPSYDHAYVRVSNNGTAWTTAWQNPGEVADTAWQSVDLDISAIADNHATVYLRWTMGTTDGGWRYCGWNIDDVRLTALICEAPDLLGDMNCDALVDFDDINPFVLALSNPAAYIAAYPDCNIMNGDCNQDGDVNFDDINAFVALLTAF